MIRSRDEWLAAGEHLEASPADEGLAAAEIVALLKGNWGPRTSCTETVDARVERKDGQGTSEMAAKAAATIDRILAPASELLELWQETDEFDTCRSLLVDVAQRGAD